VGALESAMSAKVQNFDKRLTRIVRKHRSMSNGYGFRVDKSGLITIKPKRAKSTSPIFILFMVLCVGVLFKAVALANFGPAKYADRLAPLHEGTVVEQAGAWLMEPGLVTYAVSGFVGGFIN